jgi:8-oxo-dGTP pyrophosphatase MutT (NUDIX family)
MLKSTYRDGWQLPGGIVELGESPSDGCVRETVEEVGLVIPTGRLRCVEYRPLAPGAVGPPASLQFVFDGPVYDEAPPLTLQPAEIQEARWLPPEQALELAIPHLRRRLDAMRNSPGGQCVYLEDGVRLDTVNQS